MHLIDRIPEYEYTKVLLQISCTMIFGLLNCYIHGNIFISSRFQLLQSNKCKNDRVILRVYSYYCYSGIRSTEHTINIRAKSILYAICNLPARLLQYKIVLQLVCQREIKRQHLSSKVQRCSNIVLAYLKTVTIFQLTIFGFRCSMDA